MSVRQRKKQDAQVDETPTTSETLLNDKIKTKLWSPVVAEAPNWPHNLSDKLETTKKFRLLHWGPLIALFIIGFISAVTTHFMMMWWPFDSLGGLCHLAVFVAWNYFTLVNMFNASFIGAGYIPLGWNPPEEGQKEQLQFCKPCNGFKAPRSHHCSKCKRCCMKMDHHCPWINNCVGHRNHVHFVRFLFFAIVGCTHAIVIHIICCYHLVNQMWYMRFGTGTEPFIVVTFWSLIALVGASAFAFGVAIGLSGLLFFQMKGLWKNRTGIEDYIDQKAINRYEHEEAEGTEWSYPYDLGSRRNLQDTVFNSWAGNTKGNGIWWPVMANCDQFTFTREQLAQKEAKRRMARLVKITGDFAGGIFGSCRFGCKVFVCQPISEEARVKVVPGEQWVITQCTKYWFYGYKYDEEEPTTKGWFPRRVGELQEERPYYS